MSFFTATTKKQYFRGPLLFVIVVSIVFTTIFSPIFSSVAQAQLWKCTNNFNIGHCFGVNDVESARTACGGISGCNGITSWDDAIAKKCIIQDTGGSCAKPTLVEGKSTGSVTTWLVGKAVEGLIELLQLINAGLVYLVGLAAQILDAAITISLAGLSDVEAIETGWTITRDVANIFFIFILLIIAIATILRLESYGAKQLLPKLIVIALLINFSLIIAAAVVDASNILALAFIGEIAKPSVSYTIAQVLKLEKLTDSAEPKDAHRDIPPEEAVSIGQERAFKKLDHAFTKDKRVLSATPANENVYSDNVIKFFWQATILILMLTLIFVFIALSVMLLVRSVALIVIFVLAPMGFLASILPATRGYSNQWWQKLFQWSFFFPASAFMIYLALSYGAQMSQVFTKGSGGQVVNIGVLFNFFAIVAILFGSIIVAKQMGIVGAAAAIGIGLGLARRARGLGWTGTKLAGGGLLSVTGARALGRKVGDVAGTALEGTAGRIPIVRGALSRISAGRGKAIAEEIKGVSHLSPAALANMSKGVTGLSAAASAQAFNKLKPEDQRKFADAMGGASFSQFGASAKQFGVKASTLAKASGDLHQAMQILHPEEYAGMANAPTAGDARYQRYQQQVDDFLDNLTTKEIGMLSATTVQNSDALRDYVMRSSKDLKEVLGKREHIQAFSENIGRYMTSKGPSYSVNDLADEIERGGNTDLASNLRTNIGINLIMNPEKLRTKTRRGIVTTVTAEGE